MKTILVVLSLAIMAAFSTTGVYAAASAKVEVCHIPPNNPSNFHTITVGENALPAHLAHGDLAGACNDLCASLCDDGDACTVDDAGDCEQLGCPAANEPVDCNDGLACTNDSCDSSAGCVNDVVECTPTDLCSTAVCVEPDGTCVETPKICPQGQTCDNTTGDCATEGSDCSCWASAQELIIMHGGSGDPNWNCTASFWGNGPPGPYEHIQLHTGGTNSALYSGADLSSCYTNGQIDPTCDEPVVFDLGTCSDGCGSDACFEYMVEAIEYLGCSVN